MKSKPREDVQALKCEKPVTLASDPAPEFDQLGSRVNSEFSTPPGHQQDRAPPRRTRMRLTDALVRCLPVPTGQDQFITYDSEVLGFGCRITSGGARPFILNYHTRSGRERRYTIGRFGVWSVSAARAEAKELKREVDRGQDPRLPPDEFYAVCVIVGTKIIYILPTREIECREGKATPEEIKSRGEEVAVAFDEFHALAEERGVA